MADRPACKRCRGRGDVPCPSCGGSGHHTLTSCPYEWITADIGRAFRFRDLARDGCGLPVAGGLMDQTESFLEAWLAIDVEEAYWEQMTAGADAK